MLQFFMNKIAQFPVVVLSGGKSSRMQQDKSLLPFGDYDTLIEYQYQKYQDMFERVYISAKENKLDVCYFIQDDSTEYSPMVALQSIFKKIDSEYIFIVAVDSPLVEYKTIYQLYQKLLESKAQVIVAKDILGNRHNLCGFFHKSVRDTIDKLIKKDIHRIGALMDAVTTIEVVFDDPKQFVNLNTQQDYQKACSFL